MDDVVLLVINSWYLLFFIVKKSLTYLTLTCLLFYGLLVWVCLSFC